MLSGGILESYWDREGKKLGGEYGEMEYVTRQVYWTFQSL